MKAIARRGDSVLYTTDAEPSHDLPAWIEDTRTGKRKKLDVSVGAVLARGYWKFLDGISKHSSPIHPGTGTGQDVHGGGGGQERLPIDLPRRATFAELRLDTEDDPYDEAEYEFAEETSADWMQWQPCRNIRSEAARIAGVDETENYAIVDPHADTTMNPRGSAARSNYGDEKLQAEFLMDGLVEGHTTTREIFRGIDLKQSELELFLEATHEGAVFDAPLLSFATAAYVGNNHLLDYFGDEVLMVLEPGASSFEFGDATMTDPIWLESDQDRWLNDVKIGLSEQRDSYRADFEGGYMDEADFKSAEKYTYYLSDRIDDYHKADYPREKRKIIDEIRLDITDQWGGEEFTRWAGDSIDEAAHPDEYYGFVEEMDYGREEIPKEVISGGRFRVTKVIDYQDIDSPDYDVERFYDYEIHVTQESVFDPFNPGRRVDPHTGEFVKRYVGLLEVPSFNQSLADPVAVERKRERRKLRKVLSPAFGDKKKRVRQQIARLKRNRNYSDTPKIGRKKRKRKKGVFGGKVQKHAGPGPHPSGSPQTVHGAWARGLSANQRIEDVKEEGGFTREVPSGEEKTTGWAVAVSGHEEHTSISKLTPRWVREYRREHAEALNDPQTSWGGWYDTDSGEVFLDVSIIERSKRKAIELGMKFKQKAIYNLETGEEYRLEAA